MQFVELEKEEFRTFLDTHPLKTFFQTPEMAELGQLSNWVNYYVGVKKDGKIVCATRMLSHKNRIGQNYFYAPRGLLIDYRDTELLSYFTTKLKKYIKQRHGYKLNIDPTVIHQERDANGEVIPNGINNEECVENLKKLGYIHSGYYCGYNGTKQCRWVYVLDLENKTEQQILEKMKPTTRNKIRKIEKSGIEVRELKYEELDIFKKVTTETSERKNFFDKPLSYYQAMYHLFHDKNQVKFITAQLNTKTHVKQLQTEKKEIEQKLENLEIKASNRGKIKDLQLMLVSIEKKIEKAIKLQDKGENITLAVAMFMTYGDEILYYHSGNYNEFIEFNGQTAIQWHMIQYALKHGYKRYNFYGINGIFDETSDEKGVYEFKKGFGGYVEEYIGDFDLPTNWYYYIDKLIHKA